MTENATGLRLDLSAQRVQGAPAWLVSALERLAARADLFPPRTEEELDSPVFFYPH